MLQFRHIKPIASGQHRLVFQHPDVPGSLVKVMRPELVERNSRDEPWYRRLARTGPYRGFVREFNEYLASRHASTGLSPLARVLGLVETDLGPGLVVEKIASDDGALAPNLDAWIRHHGLTDDMRAALDRLLAQLLEHNVIAADLHAWNLVCEEKPGEPLRLVMIDGFGEKNFIPLRSMSRRNNTARTRSKFRRMLARIATSPTGA
ncbi:YrbL family protein [Rhodanobacter sp. Col0626]|uniref:YrbL family protein n=1 Tax=Rhodanobacter sp. Col0626 TaxID=3415679 RepID=UPI003CE71A8B